jgi:hypothetical protein
LQSYSDYVERCDCDDVRMKYHAGFGGDNTKEGGHDRPRNGGEHLLSDRDVDVSVVNFIRFPQLYAMIVTLCPDVALARRSICKGF